MWSSKSVHVGVGVGVGVDVDVDVVVVVLWDLMNLICCRVPILTFVIFVCFFCFVWLSTGTGRYEVMSNPWFWYTAVISLVVTMTIDILMDNIITEFFPSIDVQVVELGLETAVKADLEQVLLSVLLLLA